MEKNEIKKAKIIHPFFIAIFPILIIYSQNIGKMDVETLALPLFLIVGSSVLIYFVIKLILKNANKSAIIVTIILMIMFSYGHIYYLLNDVTLNGIDIGRTRYLIPIFGVTLGIGVYFTIKTK